MSDRVDEALGVIGRLVLFSLAAALTLFLAGVALKPLLPDGLPAGRAGRALFTLLVAFGLLVANIVSAGLVERGRWSLAGIGERAWSARWLVAGPVCGAVGVLIGAALLLQLGALDAVPSPSAAPGEYLTDAVMMVTVVSALSELAFRGYVFGILADRWGVPVTIAATSAGFALFQSWGAATTGFTLIAALATSIFLGVVRWRGGLPSAWLGHLTILGVQSLLLHSPSRGIDVGPPPGWRLLSTGPDWLTGGTWGIEGGAAVAGALTVVTFLLFRIARASSPDTRS